MYKFKKDDIIIITRTESPGLKEPVEHRRGMIFKVTENSTRPFVKPNLLENRDQLGCVWEENAELLSSIPLDKICVHTKTKEQWDSVNTYLPPITNLWKNSNFARLLKDDKYSSDYTESYIIDKFYLISYEDFIDYIVPMHFIQKEQKSINWWENLKKGDYFVCTYPDDRGYCAKTNHIYPFHSLGEKNIRYAPGYACNKDYARLATPEEAELCKANNNQPTPLDWKPKSADDDRYPVKQYITFTGNNQKEVLDWLRKNGSTRSDDVFFFKYYWIDLKEPHYFNKCDNLSDIPQGFTEYNPNQQKPVKKYTSTKEWALDNGYELRTEGCGNCDLRRPNGKSCSLFHIGYQMSCNSGPSGSFHKKKSHLVEAMQSLNMAGIHLGTPEEQLPINLINVFKNPEEYVDYYVAGTDPYADDSITILKKPSQKRKLVQININL